MAPHRSAHPRRFSYGGDATRLADVAVWKFDVQTEPDSIRDSQFTAYVRLAVRGEAFRALFARFPQAKVFGTGLPLTIEAAKAEIGGEVGEGQVVIIDDLDD